MRQRNITKGKTIHLFAPMGQRDGEEKRHK